MSFQNFQTLLFTKLLPKLLKWYISPSIFYSKLDSMFLYPKLREYLMIH